MYNVKKMMLLSASVVALYGTANAMTIDNSLEATKVSSTGYILAAAQFLPEMEDSELGMGGKEFKPGDDFNKGEGNCKGYNFKKSNCTRNRSLYNACGFDATKFKTCMCNTTKYLWNASNCSYTGTKHDKEYVFGSNKCYDDGEAAKSTECYCLNKFQYTSNPSCGDSKKIIDESSYCDQSGQRRYEGCKCNPITYAKKYSGTSITSSGFQSAVMSACGHKDNFISCNEADGTIAYNCAVDVSYKYDQTSCSETGPYRVVQGVYTTFTNGNNKSITLYKGCDCPNTFNNNCNGRDAGCYWGWGGEQTCCNFRNYDDGEYNKGNCIRHYGDVSVINETGEVCTTQSGQRKVRCKCEHSGKGYDGNMCGTKINTKDEIWCYQGGNVVSKDCLNSKN